jgi:hypothetical protein
LKLVFRADDTSAFDHLITALDERERSEATFVLGSR